MRYGETRHTSREETRMSFAVLLCSQFAGENTRVPSGTPQGKHWGGSQGRKREVNSGQDFTVVFMGRKERQGKGV